MRLHSSNKISPLTPIKIRTRGHGPTQQASARPEAQSSDAAARPNKRPGEPGPSRLSLQPPTKKLRQGVTPAAPQQDLDELQATFGRLKVSQDLMHEATALGLSVFHIARILAGPGQVRSLAALVRLHAELSRFGIATPEQVQLACAKGGELSMAFLALDGGRLRALGYSARQLVSVGQQDNNDLAFAQLIRLTEPCLALGLQRADLVFVASHPSGAELLTALHRYLPALVAEGVDLPTVVRIAASVFGAQKLTVLAKIIVARREEDSDPRRLGDAVGPVGTVAMAKDTRFAPRVSPNRTQSIASLVHELTGLEQLSALMRHLPRLQDADFNPAEIAAVAGCTDLGALGALVRHLPALQNANFSPAEILALSGR